MISLTAYAFSYAAGLLAALSPCILPLLPLVLSGAAARNPLAPLYMALGLALGFALIGVSLTFFGAAIGLDAHNLRLIGAVLLALAGVALVFPAVGARLSLWLSPLAGFAHRRTQNVRGDSAASNFALGVLLGVVWSPCAGPVLGAAIGLAAQGGSVVDAFARMLFFGCGAATPLLIAAYGARGLFSRLKTATLNGSGTLKKASGVLFIILAILIISGGDLVLEQAFLTILPEKALLFLTRI